MSKRWSVYVNRPHFARYGSIHLFRLSADWGAVEPRHDGWASVTVIVLGFGVSITRWTSPDVYGDGGVA